MEIFCDRCISKIYNQRKVAEAAAQWAKEFAALAKSFKQVSTAPLQNA